MKKTGKLILATNSILMLVLLLQLQAQPAFAQWPPFWFALLPSYQDGRITYNIRFTRRVDWSMADVTFKIPLPEGTRFVEAGAQPTTAVNFDGQEITFFTSVLHKSIKDAYFVVEVTDPAATVFTAHAWIAWQGDHPGDYLTGDTTIDITRQFLDWAAPPSPSLNLEAAASAAGDTITYLIYARNANWRRMWDLKINIPIPEGTTFLSAEAPPPFNTGFDGREVSFFASELERYKTVGPLSFTVSTANISTPFLVTHAWAVWKNAGWGVGWLVPAQEDARTGDIVVQVGVQQQAVADRIGDVPFDSYDLTTITLQEDEPGLKIVFFTNGPPGPEDEPLEYVLYIDADCLSGTGFSRHARGFEYLVSYRSQKNRANIVFWDSDKRRWRWDKAVKLPALTGKKAVAVWVPYNLIETGPEFCWAGEAKNQTGKYHPKPPTEFVVNRNVPDLTRYVLRGVHPAATEQTPANPEEPPAPTPAPVEAVKEGYLIPPGDTWRYLKGFGEASYPPTAWQQPEYDDTGWLSGNTGLGYGDNDDATLLDDMRGGYVSVFLRHTFDIPASTMPASLVLEIGYDDGFVAYLNGSEVARRNLGNPGDPVTYSTPATSSREAGPPETIDLSEFMDLLQPGANVLAIQAHNNRLTGADFSINPALRWEYAPAPPQPPPAPVETAPSPAPTAAPGPQTDIIQLYGLDDAPPPPTGPPAATGITGKLAVPLDNGRVAYDVYVFTLPDGQEIARIPNARQPNIRFDGQRMLVNHEGGGIENVFEYNFANGTELQVSEAPRDAHPFYDPWGNRVVYDNPELAVTYQNADRKPFIFVQCGLRPPHQETEPRCRDIAVMGVLVPAGQMGEIQGTHPVWTTTDNIVYKGCNTWAGSKLCGIFSVLSTSTKGFSNGFIPQQLTPFPNDIPADTKGNRIAFTSNRDGDWEAYIMDLNGNNVTNLSNSPASNDGLPAISPDGNWVAFVSDREGRWAVWVAPSAGGPAQKLFDLPVSQPWGDGDRTWTNERISWGP